MVKEISARDLEAACRKCVQIKVSDIQALSRVLDNMGLEYRILSESQADIYSEINVTRLSLALVQENCEILSLHEHDESLESYYMNLLGGASHE